MGQPGMGEGDLEDLLRQMFMQQMYSHRSSNGRTRRPPAGPRRAAGVPPGVRVRFDVPGQEPLPYFTKCFVLVVVILMYTLFSLASVSTSGHGGLNFSLRETYEFRYAYNTRSGVRFYTPSPLSVIPQDLASSVESAYMRKLSRDCQEEERENARARRYQKYVDPNAEVEETSTNCDHLRMFRKFVSERGPPVDLEV